MWPTSNALKAEVRLNNIHNTNSARTSQETNYFYTTKINRLMPFKEAEIAFNPRTIRNTNAFYGQISEFCYVKAAGIYTSTKTARQYGLNFPMMGLALEVSAAVIKCGFVVQFVITPASGRSYSARSGEGRQTLRHKCVLSLVQDCSKITIIYLLYNTVKV
jgi:hypothetical protein